MDEVEQPGGIVLRLDIDVKLYVDVLGLKRIVSILMSPTGGGSGCYSLSSIARSFAQKWGWPDGVP